MRARSAVLSALAAAALSAPLAFAVEPAAPQVTDPSGDANLTATQVQGGVAAPVGNQEYADVVSALWEPVTSKVGKKTVTTGFKVTAKLTGAPTPPAPSIVVWRMLGQVNGDATLFLGPVYYSQQLSDPTTPQSALRDNLGADKVVRLTKIDPPKIDGATMTWTVPLTAVPKELKLGSKLTNLYFEVREIQDFQGQRVPDGVPVFGGATGGGNGVLDNGTSTASFQVG